LTPVSALVLFASRYGSTAEVARLIASALGVRCLPVGEVSPEDLAAATTVVIGSPIYGRGLLPEMEEFLRQSGVALRGKRLAAFVVCLDTAEVPGSGEGGARNLAKLVTLFPHEPAATAVLGGRLRMAELGEQDRGQIVAFYRRIGREAADVDRMSSCAVERFAQRVRELIGG
jgi:menaquinone-dependent protoporphyrinogen oxidase